MRIDAPIFQSHRTKSFNHLLLFVAGLLLTFASHGQTLGQALEQAWSRHPQAVAQPARKAQAQAQADIAASVTPSPPSLSLANSSDRFNANTGKNEWEIELSVPLWLPGQRATRILESESAAVEVDARTLALRLQLAGELREAWWVISGARMAEELAQRRIELARALESDTLRRFKAGDLARIDANLAQNERLTAEGEWLESQSALRQAEQAYQLLTGANAPTHLAEEALPALTEGAPVHPDLAAAQAVAQLAQARLIVAEKNRREAPELAVWMVRDRDDFHAPYANSLGVKLTIPFSSDARIRQESSAALADATQAQAELAQIRQRKVLDREKARLNVETAQQQLAKARERLALTADTLRLAEKAFALGESDLSSLLRARSSQFESQALVNRQQMAYFAGVSRLNQTLGVLP
ncbi:MAG: TolC family protein [Rhodoferax sp.]|nr:TolC family protein [Rhodoferax sp.]